MRATNWQLEARSEDFQQQPPAHPSGRSAASHRDTPQFQTVCSSENKARGLRPPSANPHQDARLEGVIKCKAVPRRLPPSWRTLTRSRRVVPPRGEATWDQCKASEPISRLTQEPLHITRSPHFLAFSAVPGYCCHAHL